MKFKQVEEEVKSPTGKMSKELHSKFIDLIQFEINKLAKVTAAKFYFYENGNIGYKKFFKYLYKSCEEVKGCLIGFLRSQMEEIPEFKIPVIITDFKDSKEPFQIMAELEDEFVEKLNDLINQAFDDKNWMAFHYLLKKLDTIDHLCCRALAAVENQADVSALIPCEQHSTEKQ